MLNLVLTLVFSIVMLLFMAFPAMKTVDWLEARRLTPPSWHHWLVILLTILFSLMIIHSFYKPDKSRQHFLEQTL